LGGDISRIAGALELVSIVPVSASSRTLAVPIPSGMPLVQAALKFQQSPLVVNPIRHVKRAFLF
jgi:beta-lactam-binding protein with PASTA domain